MWAASRTAGARPSGPPIEDRQRAGAVVADLGQQLGERGAGQRLAALVECDDGVGIACQLQQRGAFLGAALGSGGGAAFGQLMPGDWAQAQALAEIGEAVAIALQQLALGPVLQPADGGDDEAHG